MVKLSVGLWYEERFDGLSNYSLWKERIKLVLMVNKIYDFSDKEIKKLTNPKELKVYLYLDKKAKFIILDSAKNDLIHHLSRKSSTQVMWKEIRDFI